VQLQENIPLAPLTTFKVGGPARYFADARSFEEVRAAVDEARARQLPLFVLGGGSNLVIADSGWPGLVVKISVGEIAERRENGKFLFEAGAGVDWDSLVARAVARDCAGIECMSGIPGTVGGTPVQNVGAYGQEVSDTIESVLALDLENGELREICNPGCGFAYRTSIFNSSERGRYIILRVTFALAPGGSPKIAYADLKKHFAARGFSEQGRGPTLAETREAVCAIRQSKAMLIVPGDEDCRSAGSFFKNPIVSAEKYQELSRRASAHILQLPMYPAANDRMKIPAAWLVEHSGFTKGYTRGPVGISRKHALAIVNRGGATAADIITLKNEIQQRVNDEFGILLQPEPVFVGFEQAP